MSSEKASSESDSSVSRRRVSSDGSDSEEIITQSSIVEGYSNEPLADSDDTDTEEETDDEDGIPSATIAKRFNRNVGVKEWCQCGNCDDSLLCNAREFRCCKEVLLCVGKFTFEGNKPLCIIKHWEFAPLMHKAVLKNAGPLLTDRNGRKYRRKNNQSENEFYRAVAYRWIVKWLFGNLGWDNSRPLTACIYQYIRSEYPSSTSHGYKGATQRQ